MELKYINSGRALYLIQRSCSDIASPPDSRNGYKIFAEAQLMVGISTDTKIEEKLLENEELKKEI